MSESDTPMTRPPWTAGEKWHWAAGPPVVVNAVARVVTSGPGGTVYRFVNDDKVEIIASFTGSVERAKAIAALPALASALAELWDAHDKGRLIDDGLWDAARQSLKASDWIRLRARSSSEEGGR